MILKTNYQAPSVPESFDQLCAFRYPDGEIVLDFVSHKHRAFASETMEIELEWPWIDGYKPSEQDWINIGFLPLQA